MNDLDVIRRIESKLEVPLRKISLGEIEKIAQWPTKAYALDDNGNVIGLQLDGYTISLDAELADLCHLTMLTLGDAHLEKAEILKTLHGLTSLTLSGTQVTDVSFLKELKGLTSLNLFGTQVTDMSFLKELKGLTSLVLSVTSVSDVSFLKELKGLTSLDLSGTEVSDVTFLKELKGLTSLDLSGTEVSDVSFLKELKRLTRLDLSGTKVADVSFLKELKGLTSLGLSGTSVTDLSFIESLPSLVRILIYKAEQLEEPPLHIAEKGHEAIRNYFRQKCEQGKGYLHEAKALIVGEPGAGKTSMRKKLIDPNYRIPNREEVSTLGVEVEKDWNFPFIGDNTITFHASFWDFGGQDIQYMIHQYFLTGKSLYILVADERKQNTHYEYWFNIIKLLGEGSPVLVVLNKREGAAITSYDHIEICKAFPDLRIERFELDMAKENKAFDALREKIRSMLCKLDHIGAELPAKWPLIREKIEEMKVKNHISLDEYFKLCAAHGIKDEKDALFLADYLHVLGTILHFKDDDLLRDLVITNPNWVVDALYTALSDKEIEGNCGLFTRDWLFNLWKNPKQKGKKTYTEGECRQLLNLMKKERFELCYEVDEGQFISPQLLPQSPPVYSLEFKGALEFRFRYAFMPEGLLSRLIVRLNHLIRKDAYRKQLVWRYGAILERDGCIAEVTQTRFSSEGHRDISVRVVGQDYRKKELLTIIGNEIEAIHRKSFKHINFKILIPCNTFRCASSGNPKLFPLDELNKLAGYGDFTTRCTECGEMVDIYALVAGMAPDERYNYRGRNLLLKETRKYGELPLELFEESAGKAVLDSSEMVGQLLEIIRLYASNPVHASATANAASTSTATADVTVNIDINAEVKGLGNIIELIKEDLPMYVQDDSERQKMEKELELVNRAAKEIEKLSKTEAKESRHMLRITQFIDNLEKADTTIGRVIKTVGNGIDYARKLAGYYNGIAQWCGWPQVPRPFVK